MEHQDHSTENGASEHQISSITTTTTTSTGMPSFRVYVDMGTEQFANGSVVYTSSASGAVQTCIDQLKDGSHYKFTCRCGCGAAFAGFGQDIKATGKIGRAATPEVAIKTPAGHEVIMNDSQNPVVAALTADIYNSHTHTMSDYAGVFETVAAEPGARTEPSPRPFVSDRYLKKASFSLSDDEIDAYHKERPDPLEAQGVRLSEREPPAIADMVYSLATGEGPFTLLDYEQQDVTLDDGSTRRVMCGLCRTTAGGYKSVPLADLALHYDGRPIIRKRRSLLIPLMILGSSLMGSLVALAYFLS